MKKLAMFLALLFAAMVTGFADDIPTVVIAPFSATEGVEQSEVNIIQQMFTSQYAGTGKAKVVDRSKFNLIQEQMKFQSSDWSNSDKVAEFGRALNAAHVVTGEFTKFPKGVYVNIQVLDVNTTMIIASINPSLIVNETLEVIDLLPEICNELATLASGGKKKTSANSTSTFVPEYKIGDEGAGGGIVFFVCEKGFEVPDGQGNKTICHYLEVSKENITEEEISWCSCTKEKGYCYCESYTGIGEGKENTWNIINGEHNGKKISEKNCAAMACYKYKTLKTKAGDWYLPSLLELQYLYFASAWFMSDKKLYNELKSDYWVSTSSKNKDWGKQYNFLQNEAARYVSFGNGAQSWWYKSGKCNVRAIHAF